MRQAAKDALVAISCEVISANLNGIAICLQAAVLADNHVAAVSYAEALYAAATAAMQAAVIAKEVARKL